MVDKNNVNSHSSSIPKALHPDRRLLELYYLHDLAILHTFRHLHYWQRCIKSGKNYNGSFRLHISPSEIFLFFLVGHVEERLWWPIQSPNIGGKKKANS